MYNTTVNFLGHFSFYFLFRGSLVDMAEAALPLQPAGQRATVRQPGDVPHHPDGASKRCGGRQRGSPGEGQDQE